MLSIGATVNCYVLYCCKQGNTKCITSFHCQFIQKCNFYIFDSYMVGKPSFSILIKKHTFGHIQQAKGTSAQGLMPKTHGGNHGGNCTSFEAKFC